MGNSLSYQDDDEWVEMDDTDSDDIMLSDQELNQAIGEVLTGIIGFRSNILPAENTTMPVIRKKPDLSIFRNTSMYREIKASCAMAANNRRPCEHWSLMHELMRRENGLGRFSSNQQRFIQNFYIPNEREQRLMSLESNKIFLSSFNKDGSKLITASNDAIIRIFDSSKGTYHRINRIQAKDVNYTILDIDTSPCGKYFAYSTWTNNFNVVGMDGHPDSFRSYCINKTTSRCAVYSIRFSPDGSTLLGGRNYGCICLCDRETGNMKAIQSDSIYEVDINAVSYVSDMDNSTFVSGCDAGVLKLWDKRCCSFVRSNNFSNPTQRQPVATFLGHLDGITYIDSRNDGNYLLTNSKDQSIKIWDLRKPTPTASIKSRRHLPMFSWDYRWDSVPRQLYNPTSTLDGDVSVMTYRGHRVTKSLLRAKFSPKLQTGQRYIYTGCGTGRIIIYDVLTGCIKEAIEGHVDIVRDLCWHPTRAEIISSSFDSHVNLNVFKRNKLLNRVISERRIKPVRRSRRIARQNGDLDEDDDESMRERRW